MAERFKLDIRSVCPEDEEFIFQIFKSNQQWLPSLENGMTEILMHQQFEAEKKYYKEYYYDGEYSIVLINGKGVGRLYLYKGIEKWRLLSIALLPEYQNKGIGGKLIKELLKQASSKGIIVELQVAWYNQRAQDFYKKYGFNIIENIGATCVMQWDYTKH